MHCTKLYKTIYSTIIQSIVLVCRSLSRKDSEMRNKPCITVHIIYPWICSTDFWQSTVSGSIFEIDHWVYRIWITVCYSAYSASIVAPKLKSALRNGIFQHSKAFEHWSPGRNPNRQCFHCSQFFAFVSLRNFLLLMLFSPVGDLRVF
jgi:hypothetical protein